MKIGFDAKRAIQNNTGLGNYSRYVVEVLSDFFPDNLYVLFAPKKRNNPRLGKILSRKNVLFVFPSRISKAFSSLWRIWNIKSDLKKQKIAIFHGLSNELPFGIQKTGIKSVVTIHDLIFLRYPEYYKPIDRFIYRLKFKYACQKADKIIAISECTKRDIISFFRIPEEKIKVVYQGCHPAFEETISSEKKLLISRKYSLPSDFLLYVGSIESRENLLLIAKALQSLDENIHLVAVGKKTPYQEEVEKFISENGLSNRVHIFNGISFDDLPAFYQLAKIFIYPSFFEGFGIPIIEALSGGIPVIAATGSCLEEAGGPDSLYIDPTDEKELAEKIKLLWNNPKLSLSMSKAGKEYAKRFSEESIANELMKIYSSL
ncbi:MAG: glycosyltransferase family 4 protein [Dysgonamonadaceae bacterium]|jgi:glycosyltransferase involved in cell wall biosynthesis|nr:glycosyltransferase family 4 protein [Dysgonamonadaceae bacterium]